MTDFNVCVLWLTNGRVTQNTFKMASLSFNVFFALIWKPEVQSIEKYALKSEAKNSLNSAVR